VLVQARLLRLAGEEPEAAGKDRGLHPRCSYFHPHVLQHGSSHSLHFDLLAQSHPYSEGALWKAQQATNNTDPEQSGGRPVLHGAGGVAEILRVRDRGGIRAIVGGLGIGFGKITSGTKVGQHLGACLYSGCEGGK
jgi:hypothetical protein